jgi:predicted nucleic acid-binding protein
VEANIVILDEGIYAALEDEARERSLRDPRDWPVVATALALTAVIWTTTPLQGWLQPQPDL